MLRNRLTLDAAVDLTRTGDIWLFRGRSAADHAIRVVTNAPVNHVGMAIVIDDLPPLMWHAELGKGLLDVWSGDHHRGVQLHDLRAAVTQWCGRYEQHAWLRQLSPAVTHEMESAALQTVARMDGTPFPATAALAGRWVRGRLRRPASVEMTYCAEVVASTYQAMGLVGGDRPVELLRPRQVLVRRRPRARAGREPGGGDPGHPLTPISAGRAISRTSTRRSRSAPPEPPATRSAARTAAVPSPGGPAAAAGGPTPT